MNDDQRSTVRAELVVLATMPSVEVTSTCSPKCHKSALDELLRDLQDDCGDSNTEDEFNRYFTERVAPRNSNPLDWWKQNEFRFPHLAKIAKSILVIPVTSTSSERLFSTVELTVTKLRSCLKPQNIDTLVFLNQNFDLLNYFCTLLQFK